MDHLPISMKECCKKLRILYGSAVHKEIVYSLSHLTAFHKSRGQDNKNYNVLIRRVDGELSAELYRLVEKFLEKQRGGILFFPVMLPNYPGYSTSYADNRLVWMSLSDRVEIRVGMCMIIENLKKETSSHYMSPSFWGDVTIPESCISIDCEDCGSSEISKKNAIVYCKDCTIGHHQACYDIFPLPFDEEDWFCKLCTEINKCRGGNNKGLTKSQRKIKRARIRRGFTISDDEDEEDEEDGSSVPLSHAVPSKSNGPSNEASNEASKEAGKEALGRRDSAKKVSKSSTVALPGLDAPAMSRQHLVNPFASTSTTSGSNAEEDEEDGLFVPLSPEFPPKRKEASKEASKKASKKASKETLIRRDSVKKVSTSCIVVLPGLDAPTSQQRLANQFASFAIAQGLNTEEDEEDGLFVPLSPEFPPKRKEVSKKVSKEALGRRDSVKKVLRSSIVALPGIDALAMSQQQLADQFASASTASGSKAGSRDAPKRPAPSTPSSRTMSQELPGPPSTSGGTSLAINPERPSRQNTSASQVAALQNAPLGGTLEVLTQAQANNTYLVVRLREEPAAVRILSLSSILNVDDLFRGCAKSWPKKFLPPNGQDIHRILVRFEAIGGYLEIARPSSAADFVQFLDLAKRLWHKSVGEDAIYIPVLVLTKGENARGF